MTSPNGKRYYKERLPEIMKQYDTQEKQLARVLASYFDQPKVGSLLGEIRKEVAALVPELPYIGGESNTTTQFLVSAAFSLPLLLALEREGISMRDMAKISYQVSEAVCELTPPETRQRTGEFYFTDKLTDMVKKEGEVSQLRQYPGDWVFEFIQGDGRNFDYGFKFTECGIVKFYTAMKAERFVPILCLNDYANYRSLGVGFRRTQKIATHNPCCDFRFKKGDITPSGWPPDDLEEEFPF